MCNYTLSLHFESPNSCCPPSALQTASCREAHPEEHVIFKVMTTSERREQQKFSLGRVNELIGQYKHKETSRKKKEKMQKDRRVTGQGGNQKTKESEQMSTSSTAELERGLRGTSAVG